MAIEFMYLKNRDQVRDPNSIPSLSRGWKKKIWSKIIREKERNFEEERFEIIVTCPLSLDQFSIQLGWNSFSTTLFTR